MGVWGEIRLREAPQRPGTAVRFLNADWVGMRHLHPPINVHTYACSITV